MIRSKFVARGLLATCAFAIVQFVASTIVAHVIDGYVGALAYQSVTPFHERITRIDSKSPLARDGLRVGDVVDVGAMSRPDRTDWLTYLRDGVRYRIPIVRNGRHELLTVNVDRNIADDPFWQRIRLQFYIGFAGISIMLALAGFLVLKRPDNSDVAMLAAMLIFIALGENFGHFGAWDTPNDVLTIAGYAVSPFLWNAGLALLATYALRFAKPISRSRRNLTGFTYAVAALAAVLSALDPIGWWLGTIDDSFGFFSTPTYGIITNVLPSLLPLICVALAIRIARGAERSRLAWATGSLAMLYVAPVAFFILNSIGITWSLATLTKNAAFPIAALGLTYAVLGRRLLDVGFALNRAAVFAAVSIVVVGAFSLGEWALGGWLASASRSTNVVISAFLALGLGLAIHPIHTLADRFIDTVFFRRRHEAEESLRKFASEAAFITDAELVVERAIDVLRAETDCTFAEVLLHDGSRFGDVDENDPALVTLRASHEIVRLRNAKTVLRGEYCFPMSAGGRLIGALIVGPKHLGESFAPDERDAITQLAHGVGVALALLGASVARESPAALTIGTLVAAIEALPDALAAKLARGSETYATLETRIDKIA